MTPAVPVQETGLFDVWALALRCAQRQNFGQHLTLVMFSEVLSKRYSCGGYSGCAMVVCQL